MRAPGPGQEDLRSNPCCPLTSSAPLGYSLISPCFSPPTPKTSMLAVLPPSWGWCENVRKPGSQHPAPGKTSKVSCSFCVYKVRPKRRSSANPTASSLCVEMSAGSGHVQKFSSPDLKSLSSTQQPSPGPAPSTQQ